MTANGVLREWNSLTKARKSVVIENLMHILGRDPEMFEDYILDILDTATAYEQDDYFGTEGLDI